MTPEDTIAYINQLIETSKDGELGYRTAAQHVHNTQLQTIFRDYAKQRTQFALQLQAEVERLGGAPAQAGSVTAALHRGWIDVKSALSGGDGGPIIAACVTGEENAVASYQKVLDMDISGQTRAMIERQYQQVQEALLHMKRLKETHTTGGYQRNTEITSKAGGS